MPSPHCKHGSSLENIVPGTIFKETARHVLALTEKQLADLVRAGDFVEMKNT
jgi:hypothetical protein